MATAETTAFAAGLVTGYAAGWRACADHNTQEEDEDKNLLLLPTEKPPAPPAPPPPSPLLALLEHLPDLFTKEVLARLTPTDAAVFGRASRACLAVVVESST
jgi:hypothetical protein